MVSGKNCCSKLEMVVLVVVVEVVLKQEEGME